MRALMLIPAFLLIGAGPISKFDDQPPRFSGQSTRKLEDVERCLIDLPKLPPASVYRQPDRPDDVTLTWRVSDVVSGTIGRVDLHRIGSAAEVRSWLLDNKPVRGCL